MKSKFNSNSLILYEGVSLLDNKTPIICILTGLNDRSSNTKTGDMLQTWILLQDTAPHIAVKERKDSPICGNCKYSGGNGCYVKTFQAPNNIWKSWKNNRYRFFEDKDFGKIKGRILRCGSYGDPAAIPYIVWFNLLRFVDGHTGYTHQALSLDDKWKFLMASADTPAERLAMQLAGWRTFSTIPSMDNMPDNEIICPATEEGGYKATCNTCKLCSGNKTKGKNINVVVHGAKHIINKAIKAQLNSIGNEIN